MRYTTELQAYRMDFGHVGEAVAACAISRHRSRAAAGRALGSLISGKRAALVASFLADTKAATGHKGLGVKIRARDDQTGAFYARNDCKGAAL